MSTPDSAPKPALTEDQQRFLDDFCASYQPQDVGQGARVDRAAAELRDTWRDMGLVVESPRDYYVACVATVATAAWVRSLVEEGKTAETAQITMDVVIAALRPHPSP